MAIPTIVSVSDDAFQSLDSSYREASIALGASRLETVLYILFPAVFPGIFAAIMLGFGRILGETLAVLMVTGNSPIVTLSILSPVRTLTATIAAEMGEVVQGSEHYYALFSIGLLLFLVSFFINGIASRSIRRSKR
ncbi:PstC family ABC transporter permease [Fusobacterium necrophorum]